MASVSRASDVLEGDEPVVTRVNIALIRESAQALLDLQSRTGLKKVDIVNRAVQLYAFIQAELAAGGQVLIRDGNGDETLLKILM